MAANDPPHAMHPALAPQSDDSEDVVWALSAVTTLLERGENGEALKWLRRAGDAAEADGRDERAVALFKLAAEIANWNTAKPTGDAVSAQMAAHQHKQPSARTSTHSDVTTKDARQRSAPSLQEQLEAEKEASILPEDMLRRALMALDPGHAQRSPGSKDDWENRPYPSVDGEDEAHGGRWEDEEPAEQHASTLENVPSSRPLAAQRVAVLPVGDTGDVEMIFLGSGEPPPKGSAVALLVPPGPEDARLISQVQRTLGGTSDTHGSTEEY